MIRSLISFLFSLLGFTPTFTCFQLPSRTSYRLLCKQYRYSETHSKCYIRSQDLECELVFAWHGVVRSLKGLVSASRHHYSIVLVSLTSIDSYNNQSKNHTGHATYACMVPLQCFFFQLFMSRHVSVLCRLLPSSDLLPKNRDAKVATHNLVITKQYRYLINRWQA